MSAVCFTLFSAADLQIKNSAIPIKMYRAVQTGANIQLGGLKDGLLATTYQPFTPVLVKKPAREPVINGINMDNTSFI